MVGGLQDNGTMVDDSAFTQSDQPAGGDGFDVIVDPNNGNNWVGEYTDGALYTTTDGGHTFGHYASFTCDGQATVGQTPNANCDPNPRFVMPLVQDQQNADNWISGGEDVWIATAAGTPPAPRRTCDWTPVYDTGAGNSVTALSSTGNGKVIYAAWSVAAATPARRSPLVSTPTTAAPGTSEHGRAPGPLHRGPHRRPGQPGARLRDVQRILAALRPRRRHRPRLRDAERRHTWTDISGNLPDIATDALVLAHGKLALATDAGVYTARELEGTRTTWLHLGSGLPNVAVDDLTRGPNGYIYAATHGRGVWRFKF